MSPVLLFAQFSCTPLDLPNSLDVQETRSVGRGSRGGCKNANDTLYYTDIVRLPHRAASDGVISV